MHKEKCVLGVMQSPGEMTWAVCYEGRLKAFTNSQMSFRGCRRSLKVQARYCTHGWFSRNLDCQKGQCSKKG